MNNQLGYIIENWEEPQYPVHQSMEGRFCRLEPLNTKRHASELYDAFSSDHDDVWAYLPYGPFKDKEAYTVWLQTICDNHDPQFYAVIDLKSEQALGLASYLRISPKAGSIEVGHICFSSQLQQTAAATETMYLMMQYIFALGYRRYEWKCNALNQRSCQAARRLGFTFEGTFRQAGVVKGRNRNTAWFSILDKEWPKVQKGFQQWLSPENFKMDGTQRQSLQALRDSR